MFIEILMTNKFTVKSLCCGVRLIGLHIYEILLVKQETLPLKTMKKKPTVSSTFSLP